MPVLFPKSNSCLFLSVKILKNAQILFKIGNYVLKTSDFDNYWPKWCNKAKVLEISDRLINITPIFPHYSPKNRIMFMGMFSPKVSYIIEQVIF